MKQYKHEIIRAMDEAVAGGRHSCAAVAVYQHGEEKLRYACGMADMERRRPADEHSIYRLYSLTKPMTAVAAMALLEAGKLDACAPVKDYLPGFAKPMVAVGDTLVPANRDILVRDLFSMTSGLVYPGDSNVADRAMAKLFDRWMDSRAAGEPMDTYAFVNEMGKQPLLFQPGARWQYGVSADVLGGVMEVASGRKLDALLNELIFAPLGMRDTGFFVPAEKRERLTTLYELRDGALAPFPGMHLAVGDYDTPPRFCSGGAGLVSTLPDVLRFARMLLNRGELDGERVISPRAIDYMTAEHLTDAQHASFDWDSLQGYGYGVLVRTLLNPGMNFSLGSLGEFGWDGWTGPYMTVCPADDLTLVLMQQRTGSGVTELTRQVRNILFGRG